MNLGALGPHATVLRSSQIRMCAGLSRLLVSTARELYLSGECRQRVRGHGAAGVVTTSHRQLVLGELVGIGFDADLFIIHGCVRDDDHEPEADSGSEPSPITVAAGMGKISFIVSLETLESAADPGHLYTSDRVPREVPRA